jgi:LPXTG-site transpeptidase (sortase) family protein
MSRKLERICWIVAGAAAILYGSSMLEMWLYQAFLTWEFTEMLRPPSHVSIARPAAIPVAAQPVGRLEIPAIELSAMVMEGVDGSTLRHAVGHVPGTSLPGGQGNVALSAHRDTRFRHIGQLHKNDVISVTTLKGRFDYVVESTKIVDPQDVVHLRDIDADSRDLLSVLFCRARAQTLRRPRRAGGGPALVGGQST